MISSNVGASGVTGSCLEYWEKKKEVSNQIPADLQGLILNFPFFEILPYVRHTSSLLCGSVFGLSRTVSGSSLTWVFFLSFLSDFGFCSIFRRTMRAALLTKLLVISNSWAEIIESLEDRSVSDHKLKTKRFPLTGNICSAE